MLLSARSGNACPGVSFPPDHLADVGRHRDRVGGAGLGAGHPRRRDRGQTTGKGGQSFDLQAEQSGGVPAGPGGELRQPAQWLLSGFRQHLLRAADSPSAPGIGGSSRATRSGTRGGCIRSRTTNRSRSARAPRGSPTAAGRWMPVPAGSMRRRSPTTGRAWPTARPAPTSTCSRPTRPLWPKSGRPAGRA